MSGQETPTPAQIAAFDRFKKSKAPATMAVVWALVDSLLQATAEALNSQRDQLRAAQKRIDQLEAMPMEYSGTYWPEKEYRKRQFVTFGGRVWCCVAETTRNKPGLSEDWKLAVDKGRDGKDAK